MTATSQNNQNTPHNPNNNTKITQINLHGSRAATANLGGYISSEKIKIAAIQDFFQDKKTGKLTGISDKNWDIAKTKTNRAAIISRLGTKPLTLKILENSLAVLIENSTDKYTIINTYASFSVDFNIILNELEELINIAQGEILLVGDFNAHSQQWGYNELDSRGQKLTELIMQNNLFVQNTLGAPPTFHTMRRKVPILGWPDLTISSPTLAGKIKNWHVSDDESKSDHKYIRFEIGYTDKDLSRHRLETKLGKHAKFDKGTKKLKNKYIHKIESIRNINELDTITENLSKELSNLALNCYKMRKTPEIKTPDWWTDEIKMERNKVRAHRRRFQKQTDEEERIKMHIEYKKARAKLKKMVKKAKTITWKKFCGNVTNTYGPQYKTASGKSNKKASLTNILPDTSQVTIERTLNTFLDNLYLTNELTPHTLNKIEQTQGDKIPEIKKAELNRIINKIKQNKAPGHDQIDYNLIKRIARAAPKLLLALLNKCLVLTHFPRTFKTGIVVLFHKPGKDPSNPKSYRPICLLPALSKILERIIHGRVNYHFGQTNFWSNKQYGFKQGQSTEHALQALMDKIKQDKTEGYKTILATIDIKGAFDNIRWPRIIKNLKKSPCPAYLINILISFLQDRYVTLEENGIKIIKQTFGGCPQGSALGPLLWLITADTALKKNWGRNTRIQAFADDFILVLRAKTKEGLKNKTNHTLEKFSNWIEKSNLTLNWDKLELLYLNRGRSFNLPTQDSYIIEGLTCKGHDLETKEEIKYLGVIIQKNLNWQPHCIAQIAKIQHSFRQLGNMVSKNWGLKADIIKIWYRTVVEKTLTYAAPIWGNNLTKTCKDKLLSCQRQFALAIVRAYRTAPTSALLVLSGLIPINLQIQYEYAYGTVSRLRKTAKINETMFKPTDYEEKINIWKNNPAELTEIKKGYDTKDIEIYTDGSKLESGATGSAFVAFKNNRKIKTWSVPLRKCNSVFQAELLAIQEAVIWGNKQAEEYSIRSDCNSAIQALDKPFTTSKTIDIVQNLIKKSNNKFKISWVKAHVGIRGNEAADEQAKTAAQNTENVPEYHMKKPISSLKKELKQEIIKLWQFEWDYGDTGRTSHKYFPKVDPTRIISCRYLSQIYTGHGAFPEYLHRFKKITSSDCACGETGSIKHYLTSCPLTSSLHLTNITHLNKKLWYKQLAQNRHVQLKGKKIVRWLMLNIDDMTQSLSDT